MHTKGLCTSYTVWAAIAVLATVPLGIARAAIDDLLELAARKAPSYLATPLKDRINIQALVGEAEATLGAGRAYLYEALREVWDKALQGYVIDMPGKMSCNLLRHMPQRLRRRSSTSYTRLPGRLGFATSIASSDTFATRTRSPSMRIFRRADMNRGASIFSVCRSNGRSTDCSKS